MADISMKEAQARQWVQDVNDEIESVRVILKKVTQASIAVPGEDDTIMNGIETTFRAIDTAWNKMIEKFRQASSKMTSIIDILAKEANELEQKARSIGK